MNLIITTIAYSRICNFCTRWPSEEKEEGMRSTMRQLQACLFSFKMLILIKASSSSDISFLSHHIMVMDINLTQNSKIKLHRNQLPTKTFDLN